MARRRGRRGTGGQGRVQPAAQPVVSARDLAAEATACITALRQARLVAEALYAVTVLYVADHELRSHRYDDVVDRRLPLPHPDALLAVGCTAPHTSQHGPQVRLPARILERLAAENVREEDIARGERLATALLGVAASVAARDEAGRAGRFAAGIDERGAVAIEELTEEAPMCAACQSDAAQSAWRARVERAERRRAVEQALREGGGVYVSRRGGGMPRRC